MSLIPAWLKGGDDHALASTRYQGRESASARRTRKDAERSVQRRAVAKRRVPSDAASGGGEAFAGRSARSTTAWWRSS